jgi:NAD(P)H dehydrogenase (quinone)
MSKIVISGASGDMGRRITAELLEKIAPEDLTLTTRTPKALADRAAQGVRVCQADYNDPAALETGFKGSDTLMLISSLAVTRRVPEHLNAINAAKRAGIKHIVYTSVIGLLPHSPTLSVGDHHATEKNLRASGLNWTALRNGTYAEVIPENIVLPALETGIWYQIEGRGRFAPPSKVDLARCAATILLAPEKHNECCYDLSGPELMTFQDMVKMLSEMFGKPIKYVEVSVEERRRMWTEMGVPETYDPDMGPDPAWHYWAMDEMLSAEIGFAAGYQEILTGQIKMITGCDPQTMREVVAAHIARNPA